MRRFKLIAAATLVGALLTGGAATAQQEITFGHVGEPGSLFDRSATEFASRANERLEGRATVRVYGSSQLGSDENMMQRLRLGTIDLSLPSTVMSSAVPIFGLFEMPYLVQDREHMARIRDEIVIPKMAPQAEAAGYRILAVWENGFRHITNNLRPIVTPQDLAGIKLRVPGGEWRVRMFEAYGANPSPMSLSEVFVALQTGVMDGQENPYAQIYPSRFYEVQRYLTNTRHVYTPAYVVAGASWGRMAPEVQQILQETAVEMQEVVYEIAASLEDELLQALTDAGMEVNEPDSEAFIEASAPVYEAFGSQVEGGAELIEEALDLTNQ
jgi:TRAP-type transport system periplasmic protein